MQAVIDEQAAALAKLQGQLTRLLKTDWISECIRIQKRLYRAEGYLMKEGYSWDEPWVDYDSE